VYAVLGGPCASLGGLDLLLESAPNGSQRWIATMLKSDMGDTCRSLGIRLVALSHGALVTNALMH
jgi:hypothetical protein